MSAIEVTAEAARKVDRLLSQRGWSRAELARRAGLQTSQLSVVMAGRHAVNLTTVEKLASALGVPTAALLGKSMVPLYADPAQCGLPAERECETEPPEWIDLGSMFGPAEELILFVARGRSMTDDDVREGDYLVAKRRDAGEVGQRVVAVVDDSPTLKVLREIDGELFLCSRAKGYKPIRVALDTRIVGVLVGIIRQT